MNVDFPIPGFPKIKITFPSPYVCAVISESSFSASCIGSMNLLRRVLVESLPPSKAVIFHRFQVARDVSMIQTYASLCDSFLESCFMLVA